MQEFMSRLTGIATLEWLILILAVVVASLIATWMTRRLRLARKALTSRAIGAQPAESRWHAIELEKIFELLKTRPEGLSSEEATRRLEHYGPNRLPEAQRRSALVRFFYQFNNILIYVLLIAAAITSLLGHWVDSGVIAGVVVINALIGFIQEGKAEDALQSIRNMLTPQAVVLRDGSQQTIPAHLLGPGDVVILQAGDKVPADIRLFRVKNLQAQEAALTGESIAVSKTTEVIPADVPLGDRRNLVFAGTLITAGQGAGAVVATGANTELGRISALLAGVEPLQTPLLQQLSHFGKTLTVAILGLAALTFLFGILVWDFSASEMFLAAVGLAVAAIPEGLPAIMTITLAIGVQRMARRNAIIRRLPAVETLGAVTVICSDKTGTLTRNEMTARSIGTARDSYQVTGVGYDPHGTILADGKQTEAEGIPVLIQIARAALLCNDASLIKEGDTWQVQGDPTEGALLILAMKLGLTPALEQERYPRTDIIPFESEHRYMATLHHDHEGHAIIYLKGAPEVVLDRCRAQYADDCRQALDMDYWLRQIDTLAKQGQRVLAIACKETPGDKLELTMADVEHDLCLLGLIGMIDPPRQEATEAIKECHTAGIGVKMITGDHAVTAIAIARQLGLRNEQHALTGHDLELMSDALLRESVKETDVFARTSPEHKLRLVQALQANGDVVAMTGDGVNDAPALKRADVGIAMGKNGTEAAKEASEMVLIDDNFATIVHAVEEGRTVYDNLKKAILFILPTNGGEAFTLVAAVAMGRMFPITAAQILWVNMITAVTLALALAFEPSEKGLMKRPPRDPHEPLLSAYFIWRILFVSSIIVAGTFGLFIWERNQGTDIETARTIAVNTLVMFELFYLFNSRYLYHSVFNKEGFLGSRMVWIMIGILLLFQGLFTYLPWMQYLFHSRPLDVVTWSQITVVSSSVLVLVEMEKLMVRRFRTFAVSDITP